MTFEPWKEIAYSKCGASMGRRAYQREFSALTEANRVHLRRVPIDAQGYDQGGAYWGIGLPLYCAWWEGEEGKIMGPIWLRASSREEAKRIIVQTWPAARFLR